MLNNSFLNQKTCNYHINALYLRHLIYDFELLTKSSEVGYILRQPLFIFMPACLLFIKNNVIFAFC